MTKSIEKKVEVVDMAKVDDKIVKGEELTPEEIKAVMSSPPEDYNKVAAENEDIFKDIEVIEEPPKEKEKPEAKKEPETPPEKVEPPKEDTFDRIEKELSKPEGKEDLVGLTDREKAYFWQMRRDRRARQKAEEDRDLLRFERVKEKAQAEMKAKEPEPEVDIFKDRDPEDFVTVKDIKSFSDKQAKKENKSAEPLPPDPIKVAYLKMCDKEAAKQFADYEEVMACTPDIVSTNNVYQLKIVEALMKGDNPAAEMYSLIKGDPEFPKVLERIKAQGKIPETPKEEKKEPSPAELKKAEEAKEAQKKLEENTTKPKTSGHIGGLETAPGEITLEQLSRMSDREFAKIPKQTRDKYLRMFGA